MACLPDRLKAEIAIHVHLDTLKRVDIFQNTEAGFLCELVLRLKPVLFSPGDYVCRKNEVGHEMYIVSRGTLEVVAEVEQDSIAANAAPKETKKGSSLVVVATLKAGSYFGEISVLNVGSAGNKRTASVRSVGYSDLFCLNKEDLWDVLKNYPAAERRIRARAEERLSKLENNQQHVGSGCDTPKLDHLESRPHRGRTASYNSSAHHATRSLMNPVRARYRREARRPTASLLRCCPRSHPPSRHLLHLAPAESAGCCRASWQDQCCLIAREAAGADAQGTRCECGYQTRHRRKRCRLPCELDPSPDQGKLAA